MGLDLIIKFTKKCFTKARSHFYTLSEVHWKPWS